MPDVQQDLLLQVGVGGTVALLLLREVFGFVRKRNGNGALKHESAEDMRDEIIRAIEPMKSQLRQLYDWHNISDEDGVKLWYVRRSLETSLKELSENISKLTDYLKDHNQ